MYVMLDAKVEGDVYRKLLDCRHFDEGRAVRYLLQVMPAVQYCHDMHIVHRDIRPENLLLTVDVGIASFLLLSDEELTTRISSSLLGLGTLLIPLITVSQPCVEYWTIYPLNLSVEGSVGWRWITGVLAFLPMSLLLVIPLSKQKAEKPRMNVFERVNSISPPM